MEGVERRKKMCLEGEVIVMKEVLLLSITLLKSMTGGFEGACALYCKFRSSV